MTEQMAQLQADLRELNTKIVRCFWPSYNPDASRVSNERVGMVDQASSAVVQAEVRPIRMSWDLNRWERAWWHLRCGRVRLAWVVLRHG